MNITSEKRVSKKGEIQSPLGGDWADVWHILLL